MILSVGHVQAIRMHVESSEISSQFMRDDLIDHLCCSVESKMKKGTTFQPALASALDEMAPRGFKEIEIEAYYLLKAKVILMKKFKFGITLLGSMSFCFGIAAKTLQLSIGNDFLLFGLIFLTLGIPFLSFKQNMPIFDRIRVLSAFLSLLFVTAGFALKITSSAGANLFVVIGSCLFALCFLPLYFIKLYRASLAS